jgi:outer membrane protein assembly factor BamB
MRNVFIATLIISVSPCIAGEPVASSWTEFRNGGSSHSAAEMPVSWSPDKGISWQKELPGYGQSCPVVFNGRVYVTAVVGPMKDECQVLCLDLKTGEQIWVWSQEASAKAASNYMASRAAPTPIVDANGVCAFFEGGDLIGISHDGNLKWKRCLTSEYGKFENNHGLGSSPTQTSDLVIVNIEHKGPSYLLAADKSTGETRWKVTRPSGSSWTSPIVIQHEGREQVIVSSGGTVDSYHAADGEHLWTVGGLSGNSVPSPTAVGPYLFVGARIPEFGSAQEASQSNLCLKLETSSDGQHEVVWRASKAVCDYASPVVDRDCAYYLNNVGVLYCVSSVTGETHYTERLGTTCWATPIVAGDNVFFFGKDGKTVVVRSGATFAKVSTNLLWDPKHAPVPESYKEHQGGGHGHGEADAESVAKKDDGDSKEAERTKVASSDETGSNSKDNSGSNRRGGPSGGMAAMLLKSDSNGDGRISAEELPAEFREMMVRVDLNKDNVIDADELKAMEESFRKRREGSRDSARDPIVYGVAAADGAFLMRTGTRLFCVRGE